MTIDKSLKTRATSVRVRNVLTRDERIARLLETDKFAPGTAPVGLPKVRVYKLVIKKKKKKEAEEGADKKKAAKKK